MTKTALEATPAPASSIGHLHGYARVSTTGQDAALQHGALTVARVDRIWTDTASGTTTSRPQLDMMLSGLLPGDVVVVWRLDRLGRSLPRHRRRGRSGGFATDSVPAPSGCGDGLPITLCQTGAVGHEFRHTRAPIPVRGRLHASACPVCGR